MKPKVHFLQVKDTRTKLGKICETVQREFEEGNKVLINVPNDAAAKYVDELLWRLPQESFLPHERSEKKTKEKIIITTVHENFNEATVLFNLCPDISPLSKDFDTVYELYDETDPQKAKLSENRRKAFH